MARVNDSFGGLLKGSLVTEAGKKHIAGVILNVRVDVKGVNSPYVIDFDTEVLKGVTAWPCNITEARKLAKMISPETNDWRGCAIVLTVVPKNNPQANNGKGAIVDGLTVSKVIKAAEVKKNRKTKPTITLEQSRETNAAAAPDPGWDEVPF